MSDAASHLAAPAASYTPAPIPGYDDCYSFDPTRHLMRYVYDVDRDAFFEDLFGRLGVLQ